MCTQAAFPPSCIFRRVSFEPLELVVTVTRDLLCISGVVSRRASWGNLFHGSSHWRIKGRLFSVLSLEVLMYNDDCDLDLHYCTKRQHIQSYALSLLLDHTLATEGTHT